MTTTSYTRERRILGFDILRLLSMVAIITFHVNEAVFWKDTNPIESEIYIYRFFEFISQHLTFSGFTVIALSFFLMGRGRRQNFLPLMLFLGVGILVLASFQVDPPFSGFYWEWDIYSFLMVSVVAIQLIAFLPRWQPLFVLISFAATWIPVWRLVPNAADTLSQAFVGICPPEGVASWPLFPWLAWPVLFFSLGGCFKQSAALRQWSSVIRTREILIWIGVLGVSAPFFGTFNWVPIGPNFYCHTLRREPYLFWATMIWVIFFMRLSLVEIFNQWLGKKVWARAIGDLRWNTRFGATYLTHLPLLGLGIYLRDVFFQHPWLFDMYFISILPAAEGIVRGAEKILLTTCRHDGNRSEN